MHVYVIVASPLLKLSEESFQNRLSSERNPSLEGRIHFYFIDTPVTFGCVVFDQQHWVIDFPPNPADLRSGAILFRDHPEGARLLASFIHHQWLEQPGVTTSLSEAYEVWKAMHASSQAAQGHISEREAPR